MTHCKVGIQQKKKEGFKPSFFFNIEVKEPSVLVPPERWQEPLGQGISAGNTLCKGIGEGFEGGLVRGFHAATDGDKRFNQFHSVHL